MGGKRSGKSFRLLVDRSDGPGSFFFAFVFREEGEKGREGKIT